MSNKYFYGLGYKCKLPEKITPFEDYISEKLRTIKKNFYSKDNNGNGSYFSRAIDE